MDNSNSSRQLSLRGRNMENSKRLDALEQDIPRILTGINEGFTRISTQLSELTEIVNAVVFLVGEEDVAKAVTDARIAKAKQESEAAQAALEKAVADGQFKASETITETSIIVGTEKDKDGTVIPPGRAQLQFAKLLPKFKEELLGKTVGFVVTTPPGGSFEVTAVFDQVPQPPTEAPNPVPPTETPAVDAVVAAPSAPSVEVVQ